MSDAYLYVTKCIIPNLLIDAIQHFDAKQQLLHCRAASLIKVLAHKEKFGKVNIGRRVWQNLLGIHYRAIINNLLKLNIIRVQKNNDGKESYSNGANRFCKCYTLTDEANASGFAAIDFGTPKPYFRADNKLNILDDIQIYVKNILNNHIHIEYITEYTYNTNLNTNLNTGLNTPLNTIPFSPFPHMCIIDNTTPAMDDLINKLKGHEWLKRLSVNDFEVSYGERGGRLYHPVICMPKIARKYVWFKDCDTVFDCDVKTAFPVLLAKFVHPNEKDGYKAALDADIYSLIAGKEKRDACKEEFNKFINGNVSNFVKTWFVSNLPKTAEWIAANYQDMAARLQRLESDIMIQKLGAFIIKNKISNWIPCHDGWLLDGNEQVNNMIIEFVKDAIEQDCGYRPQIKVVARTRSIR